MRSPGTRVRVTPSWVRIPLSPLLFFLMWIVPFISACGGAEASLPTRVVLPTESATLTPMPTNIPLTGTLNFWEAQSQIISTDTNHLWRFSAFAGDNIALRVVGEDMLLTLMTDMGDILTTGDDITSILPTTGFYRVMVRGTGEYQIGLGYADKENPNSPTLIPLTQVVGIPTPNPLFEELGVLMGALSANAPIQQTILADARQRYTFMGVANTYIQLEAVTDMPQNTPHITLYAPDGSPIATDGGSGANGSARLRNIRLDADGVYTIQLIGATNSPYTLVLNTTERLVPVVATQTILPTATPYPNYVPPEAQPLVAGQRLQNHIPIRASLTRPDGVYIYSLYADAGTIITIGASPVDNPQVRLRLELVDPDGAIITRATVNGSVSNGDTVIPAFPVAISGVYQIFVTSENGVLGDYTLSYGIGATRLDRYLGVLAHDIGITQRIDKRGVRHVWVLELQRGDTITLSATPNDLVFDPVMELVPATRPDELTVIDDNSGGNRAPFVRSITIGEDGLYLLRIYAQNAASLGGYTLVWRYIDRASTPTPPSPAITLMTVRDVVEQDTYAFYPIQGYAGQKIEVQVIGETAGFDPVAALIAPTGETLIEADDSNGTLNPTFTFTIPADGVYRLRVNGYLSGGAFVVLVRELF